MKSKRMMITMVLLLMALPRSVGLYLNGSQVLIMGFDGTWAHVIVDGRVGFMQHRFLR